MWILPKQLHTSRFVADMTELGLDSEEFGQMSEMSLMWRSKPSQQRTWSQRWKRVSWIQHLSGRILKHSQHGDFEDAWTSSVRDSRASHSVVQEQEPQTATPDTSGPMCDRQLDLFDHGWLSLRTSKESSVPNSKEETGTTQKGHQYCFMSSENWKEQVTSVRGEYSQRLKSGLHISESEFLSWATPQARDWNAAEPKEKWEARAKLQAKKGVNLHLPLNTQCHHIMEEQLDGPPTQEKSSTSGKNHGSWPTPNQRDYMGARRKLNKKCENVSSKGTRFGLCINQAVALQEKSNQGSPKLNPNWVEQLMGLPVGWTDFDSSAME